MDSVYSNWRTALVAPLFPEKIHATFYPTGIFLGDVLEIVVEEIIQNGLTLDAVIGLNLLAEREKRFEVPLSTAESFNFYIGDIEIVVGLVVRTEMVALAYVHGNRL